MTQLLTLLDQFDAVTRSATTDPPTSLEKQCLADAKAALVWSNTAEAFSAVVRAIQDQRDKEDEYAENGGDEGRLFVVWDKVYDAMKALESKLAEVLR